MDSEFSPLNPSSTRRSRVSLLAWWALNIFLVIFVFLAFVLSAASLNKDRTIERYTSNNVFVQQWRLLVGQTLTVAQNHNIQAGSIVSYTDNPGEVGTGLGPQWSSPVFLNETTETVASWAELSHFSSSVSAYAFVPAEAQNTVRVRLIFTPSSGGVQLGPFGSVTAANNVTFVHVRVLNPTTFAVIYTSFDPSENGTITSLFAVTTAFDYSFINIYPTQVISNGPFFYSKDLLAIVDENNANNAWLMLIYGDFFQPCTFTFFQVNPASQYFLSVVNVNTNNLGLQCTFALRSHYLQGGYFVLANENSIVLAQAHWTTLTINQLSSQSLGTHNYLSLHMTNVSPKNLLVLSGVETPGLEGGAPITQVVQYTLTGTPSITIQPPVKLIPSITPTIYRGQIRSCYSPPDPFHPNGVLLFTYVDSSFMAATLIRGKIVTYESFVGVLSSATVGVSLLPYVGSFNDDSSFPPLLMCPTAAGEQLMVYQSKLTALSTFYWHGGYKLAGIAQADASSGKSVYVIRQGVSTAHTNLLPGFGYYINNTGDLHPGYSLNELFTPNGIPALIGESVSNTELLMNFEVIEQINNFYQ